MRYTFLITSFLLAVMATSYYTPHLAQAQTSDREICNEETCHVKITKDGFMPKTLIVKIGTTIVWTNTDDGRHTVTSGSPVEITSPLKSLLLEKGNMYEFTFEYSGLYKGSYQYFDQISKTMRGEIIVGPEPEKTEVKPQPLTIKVDFQNSESGVKAVSLSNGSIKSMEIVTDSQSLLITVETEQTNGKLDITLDRKLIDAKTDGEDTAFAVMVDGHEGFLDETSSTAADRTLQIVVPGETMEIEIMGTQVIPEFPTATLIIAGIFTTMIAVYRLGTRFN